MHIPVICTSPLGWIILGTAGYIIYKAGKSSGKKSAEKELKKTKAEK